ncbi:MAG: hypothetical protein WBO45_14935, partial [Planctomycetota bacterium]
VLQVQSDARGRAQARLRPGLCYVAWAVGPANAQGERAVSPVQGWFGASSLFTLKLGSAAADRRLELRGTQAWAREGPLRFVAVTSLPGVEIPVEVKDGALVVPPGPVRVIETRSAAGAILWSALPTSEYVLPPPRSLTVKAVDERGAPLAGAQVRHRVARLPPWRFDALGGVNEDRWRELGTTGADGLCVVEVPYGGDPLRETNHGDLLLFVGATGRPGVAGGVFNKGHCADDRKVAKIEGDELVFTCRAQPPLVGSVGRPPQGAVAHLAAVSKIFLERTSFTHDPRSFVVPIGPDGTFRFDDVPLELHTARLTIVAPDGTPQDWPVLPTMPGRELPPEVAGRGEGLAAEGFADLELAVVEAGGGPARGMIALLAPSGRSSVLLRDSGLRLPLDGRGACKQRFVPGKWIALVCGDAGYAAAELDLVRGTTTVTLTMQPCARMRLEVRDAAGKPVSGAQVTLRGTTVRGSSDPVQALLQNLRTQWTANWNALRTDGSGRVVIPGICARVVDEIGVITRR